MVSNSSHHRSLIIMFVMALCTLTIANAVAVDVLYTCKDHDAEHGGPHRGYDTQELTRRYGCSNFFGDAVLQIPTLSNVVFVRDSTTTSVKTHPELWTNQATGNNVLILNRSQEDLWSSTFKARISESALRIADSTSTIARTYLNEQQAADLIRGNEAYLEKVKEWNSTVSHPDPSLRGVVEMNSGERATKEWLKAAESRDK